MELREYIKPAIDSVFNKIRKVEEKLPDTNCHILNIDRSLQLDSYSCGVQSTFVILKYYGKARSVKYVEKLLGTDKDGTSETAIYKLFRKRGLKVSLRKTATFSTIKDSISNYEAPFLTTIYNYEHYIVVYGFSDSYIYVLDPLIKHPFVRWNKKKFKDRWDSWGAIIYK